MSPCLRRALWGFRQLHQQVEERTLRLGQTRRFDHIAFRLNTGETAASELRGPVASVEVAMARALQLAELKSRCASRLPTRKVAGPWGVGTLASPAPGGRIELDCNAIIAYFADSSVWRPSWRASQSVIWTMI